MPVRSFPDGHEDGLEHNQIFIFYAGKINLYEDYFTFSDDSVGNIIVSYENIDNFEYLEERNYTVILIRFKDMDNLPLSGIVKNEIIFYFKGSTERWRSYSREMIDFMRNIKCLRGKIGILNDDKKFEYEIVMRTINDNEIYNLSNISNSFNLTNVCDSVNEMIEYEYLKYNHNNFDKFIDYKNKLNEYLEEIKEVKENNNNNEIIQNKKLMFVFGTNPLVINNIKKKLVDFIRKSAQCVGTSKGCKSVENVMFSRYAQIHMGQELSIMINVEARHAVLIKGDVHSGIITVGTQSEGDDVVKSAHCLIDERICVISDYHSVLRDQMSKFIKGSYDLIDVLEIVQMV